MPAPLRRDAPPSLHDRAVADLRFIRGAMERSGSFTAVPGLGGVGMGAVAIAAAAAARWAAIEGRSPGVRLMIWMAAAAAACLVGLVAMRRKASREGVSLLQGPGRRFLLCLCPALVAGALMTAALARAGQYDLLPAAWMLLYGAGVVAAGAQSVPVIPATGGAFLVAGAVALASPPAWGDALMAASFGGFHVVSGILVARRHGG